MGWLYWPFAGRESYYPLTCRVTQADGLGAYGTQSLAGGVPAGTVYRVTLDPPHTANAGLRRTIVPDVNHFELRLTQP